MTRFYINGRWVELKELIEKSEKWDFINSVTGFTPQKFVEQKEQIKAIKNYLNELEDTGRFIDKQRLMNILEGE